MENGLIKNDFLESFEFEGVARPVRFVESMEVADGVSCDVYKFTGDDSMDLGIIKITPGCKTPLQKVLKGERTVEGYISGAGRLVIKRSRGGEEIYGVRTNLSRISVDVKVGDTMQWEAAEYEELIAYEICVPPYEPGRYEDLA